MGADFFQWLYYLEGKRLDFIIWIVIVMIIAVLWISAFDSNRIVESVYEFESDKIKKPLRFVFLSDLHCKMFGYEGTFLIEKIREAAPDMILVGGDMITAHPHTPTDKTEKFMKNLAAIGCPVFYGIGNHELRLQIYPETYGNRWDGYKKKLEEYGIRIVENGSVSIPEAGINLISFSPNKKYYKRGKKIVMEPSYINETAGPVEKEAYNVLLAHNPAFFETYAAYGADLTLSGHVHGGLVRIPVPVSKKAREEGAHLMRGVISPGVRLFPKYDSGRFDKDGSVMLVSRGLGSHTIHIRVFNPADLILIDLKPHNGV